MTTSSGPNPLESVGNSYHILWQVWLSDSSANTHENTDLSSSCNHVRYEVSMTRSIQQLYLEIRGLKLVLSYIHSDTSERESVV